MTLRLGVTNYGLASTHGPSQASGRMAIPVTCPGCRTRFQVSDQHAGKSGPCPKCKTTIRVPTKEEEVKIEVPEQFVSGGRTVSGGVVFKPNARKEVKFNPMVA